MQLNPSERARTRGGFRGLTSAEWRPYRFRLLFLDIKLFLHDRISEFKNGLAIVAERGEAVTYQFPRVPVVLEDNPAASVSALKSECGDEMSCL